LGLPSGLGKSEWCGSWKLFWPDGRILPHDQCPMAVAVKEQQAVRGLEAVAERPDGTRVLFLPFSTPIFNTSGVFVGAVNMLVDITERKRAEEATQRLASIVESSDDAIISKDLDGIFTSWNKGAERIFDYMPEEIICKSIKVPIPLEHQEEENTIIERIRRGECRDITDRKRSEAQISILAREAEHRTKNILTTVPATVQLSQSNTCNGLKSAIQGRIRALANAHSLFVHHVGQALIYGT
jgi:PAS domain S-box-containing protein